MKHTTVAKNASIPLSHPVWVRGLKPLPIRSDTILAGVAPRVGAWIETWRFHRHRKGITVAPRVGAWIETFYILY